MQCAEQVAFTDLVISVSLSVFHSVCLCLTLRLWKSSLEFLYHALDHCQCGIDVEFPQPDGIANSLATL